MWLVSQMTEVVESSRFPSVAYTFNHDLLTVGDFVIEFLDQVEVSYEYSLVVTHTHTQVYYAR
jgi:hypothetical protein